MAYRCSSSAWSDLPPDLLGLVLLRLHSLTDRIRVGAVCRPWRSGARLHPKLPPPMPWLALGNNFYLDIVNNAVHRRLNLTIRLDATCSGSVDHLLFLTRDGGGCFLADPFTGTVHPVPDLAFFLKDLTREEMFSLTFRLNVSVRKVVQAHWPTPSSAVAAPVVAALIKNTEDGNESCRTTIFVCGAGTDTGVDRESYRTMSVDLRCVLDIAFFRGNLYALSTHGQLLTIEIAHGVSGGNPMITNVSYAIKSSKAGSYDDFNFYEDNGMVDFTFYAQVAINEAYLVESGDRLLMLNRWVDNDRSGDSDTHSFDVYEADLDTIPCRWKQAHDLCGRALFLGQYGSSLKSIYVDDRYCGAQKDCIYFVRHADDSGIYNVRSGKMMKPLVPDRKVLKGGWRMRKVKWVFPDQSLVQSHYFKTSRNRVQGASALDGSNFDFLLWDDEDLI
ncbi:unnamed protein product [Urochloa humidicola]